MPRSPARKNAEPVSDEDAIRQLGDQLARTGRVEIGFHHWFLILIWAICATFGAVALRLVVIGEGSEVVAGWLGVAGSAVPAGWAIREWRTGRPVLVVDQLHVSLPRRGLEIPWSAVLGAWSRYQPGGGANLTIKVDPQQFPSIRKPVNVPGMLAVDDTTVAWWLAREASARRER